MSNIRSTVEAMEQAKKQAEELGESVVVPKDRVLGTRVTPEEAELFERKAWAAGLSVSEWTRQVLRTAAGNCPFCGRQAEK